MKVALLSILLLVGFDFAVNHGAVTRRFCANVAEMGQTIGGWVYYSS